MQLSGGFLEEAMLCRIGHAYEKATSWNEQHPNF
jgi:Asp-tRNA(Asn)/Glu-tRNA(Gln) amidotransferase A subunit family amidase